MSFGALLRAVLSLPRFDICPEQISRIIPQRSLPPQRPPGGQANRSGRCPSQEERRKGNIRRTQREPHTLRASVISSHRSNTEIFWVRIITLVLSVTQKASAAHIRFTAKNKSEPQTTAAVQNSIFPSESAICSLLKDTMQTANPNSTEPSPCSPTSSVSTENRVPTGRSRIRSKVP